MRASLRLMSSVKKPAYVLATAEQLQPLLNAGWTQNQGERETLSKTYKFKGFKPAWRFMNAVADSANSLNHRLFSLLVDVIIRD